jgi:DHA1 family tetracycline resistance protein-like MFS transporter
MPHNSLSGLIIPGLQGLMTRHVSPAEQGQLQGANQSLQGIAGMVGPVIFGLTFAWSVRHSEVHLPGLAVAIASAIMGLCLVMALRVDRAPAVA